jgi:hypothetical protein
MSKIFRASNPLWGMRLSRASQVSGVDVMKCHGVRKDVGASEPQTTVPGLKEKVRIAVMTVCENQVG